MKPLILRAVPMAHFSASKPSGDGRGPDYAREARRDFEFYAKHPDFDPDECPPVNKVGCTGADRVNGRKR